MEFNRSRWWPYLKALIILTNTSTTTWTSTPPRHTLQPGSPTTSLNSSTFSTSASLQGLNPRFISDEHFDSQGSHITKQLKKVNDLLLHLLAIPRHYFMKVMVWNPPPQLSPDQNKISFSLSIRSQKKGTDYIKRWQLASITKDIPWTPSIVQVTEKSWGGINAEHAC